MPFYIEVDQGSTVGRATINVSVTMEVPYAPKVAHGGEWEESFGQVRNLVEAFLGERRGDRRHTVIVRLTCDESTECGPYGEPSILWETRWFQNDDANGYTINLERAINMALAEYDRFYD